MNDMSLAIFFINGFEEVGLFATISHCIEFTIWVSNLFSLNLWNIAWFLTTIYQNLTNLFGSLDY